MDGMEWLCSPHDVPFLIWVHNNITLGGRIVQDYYVALAASPRPFDGQKLPGVCDKIIAMCRRASKPASKPANRQLRYSSLLTLGLATRPSLQNDNRRQKKWPTNINDFSQVGFSLRASIFFLWSKSVTHTYSNGFDSPTFPGWTPPSTSSTKENPFISVVIRRPQTPPAPRAPLHAYDEYVRTVEGEAKAGN